METALTREIRVCWGVMRNKADQRENRMLAGEKGEFKICHHTLLVDI